MGRCAKLLNFSVNPNQQRNRNDHERQHERMVLRRVENPIGVHGCEV
jgi:hypothetical protein